MSKKDKEKNNTFQMDDDFGLEFQKTLEENKKKKNIEHNTSDMLKIGKIEEVFQQNQTDSKPTIKSDELLKIESLGDDRTLKRVSYSIEKRHIDFITRYAEKTNRSKNAFLRYVLDKVMDSLGEE